MVFLLYAHVDKDPVRRLYKRVLREGANAWLDRAKIQPGQEWEYEIRKAIMTSDIIIVCLSEAFNRQGGYRHEELRLALEKASSLPTGEILLLPARLENCDLPEPLRRWQRVDLFEAGGYGKLWSALQGRTRSR